ncbi:MAG: hypothetical protein WD887_02450 [Candidatus Saccharimonadales bacterium]
MLNRFRQTVFQSFHNTGRIVTKGLRTLKKDPQIAAYPYIAAIFIATTLPIVNGLVFGLWNKLWHSTFFSVVDNTPQDFRILLGVGSFSFFYTALVTAYFSYAASAAVLQKLEGRPTSFLYGLRVVLRRFGRVTKFALVSIFFFPLGIIAQYRKLPKGIFGVIISSFTLHTPQIAPEVVSGRSGLLLTIRNSIEILGKVRYEGVIIRVAMIIAVLLLGLTVFLPPLIEKYWLDSETANLVGWLAGLLLGATSYVALKVVGTVFTTTLYYEAKNK